MAQQRLTWSGNREAQRQHSEAYARFAAATKARHAAKEAAKRSKKRRNTPRVFTSYAEYLKSPQWQKKRRRALKKYGKVCSVCGTTERLQVHHKHYKTLYRESVDDLAILCAGCHANHHEEREICLDPMATEFVSLVRSF